MSFVIDVMAAVCWWVPLWKASSPTNDVVLTVRDKHPRSATENQNDALLAVGAALDVVPRALLPGHAKMLRTNETWARLGVALGEAGVASVIWASVFPAADSRPQRRA